MTNEIRLRKAGGVWVVRANGAVLGESRDAVELSEGELEPVIYFPRTDIAMVFLEPGTASSHCQAKGEAEYFSITSPGGTLLNAAWSYPNPPEALARIAGHLAFAPGTVTVEQL